MFNNNNKTKTGKFEKWDLISRTQESTSNELNNQNVSSSSTMNFTDTKAQITNTKVTTENNRKEYKTETVTNLVVTTSLSPNSIRKAIENNDFDINKYFSDKLNNYPEKNKLQMLKISDNNQKTLSNPYKAINQSPKLSSSSIYKQTNEIKIPETTTKTSTNRYLDKRNFFSSTQSNQPTELKSLTGTLLKPPILSSPKQTSLTSTKILSAPITPYVSPYKKRDILNNDENRFNINTRPLTPVFKAPIPKYSLSSWPNTNPTFSTTNKTFENKNTCSSSPPTNLLNNNKSNALFKPTTTSCPPKNPTKETKYFFPLSTKSNKISPGFLHIFHHDEFKNSNTEYREGSKHDVKLLKDTFSKFQVKSTVYENYTVAKIKRTMKRISTDDYSNNSCIIFAILSHGNRMDQIAAHDGNYSINDDILFELLKNKTLLGKPKILIIQACKGSFDTRNLYTDNNSSKDIPGIPDEIYKFYSTSEGFVSFRDKTGTVFIQQFCSELSISGRTKNIRDIMDSTVQKVKNATANKQIPSMCVNNTVPYIFGNHM